MSEKPILLQLADEPAHYATADIGPSVVSQKMKDLNKISWVDISIPELYSVVTRWRRTLCTESVLKGVKWKVIHLYRNQPAGLDLFMG